MAKADKLWAQIEDCENALAVAQTYAVKEALKQRLVELSAEWREA